MDFPRPRRVVLEVLRDRPAPGDAEARATRIAQDEPAAPTPPGIQPPPEDAPEGPESGPAGYPEGVVRPRTRADCRDGPRPCPFVSCEFHLALIVTGRRVKERFPGVPLEELAETCTLDVAERGGASLDQVSTVLGVSRQRVEQIEKQAYIRAAKRGADLREFVDDGAPIVPRRQDIVAPRAKEHGVGGDRIGAGRPSKIPPSLEPELLAMAAAGCSYSRIAKWLSSAGIDVAKKTVGYHLRQRGFRRKVVRLR